MTAEIGHALLWLALGCALLQAVAGLVPRAGLGQLAVPAAMLQGWLWLWVAAALLWSFYSTDLSVAAVATNSDAALPAALRLAGVAVQAGGGLVAAAALAAWGGAALAFVAGAARQSIGAAGTVGTLLSLAVLLGVQPFARAAPAPTAGAGFPVAARAWLAALAPPGPAAAGTIAALTPVAGPDSTGVIAEVHVGGATLLPEWRETTQPRAAFAVADSGLDGGDWIAASLRPDGAGWQATATRLPLWPAAALLLAVAGLIWWWRR